MVEGPVMSPMINALYAEDDGSHAFLTIYPKTLLCIIIMTMIVCALDPYDRTLEFIDVVFG